MPFHDDIAALLGRELRRGRHAVRKRQSDVAAEIGSSQPVVSRMELGQGGGIGLNTWVAAARAVDMRLEIEVVADGDIDPRVIALGRGMRCHRTVVDVSRRGGWSAVSEVRHDGADPALETTLSRGDEVAVVQVWDPFVGGEPGIERLEPSMDRARDSHSDASTISCLVVIPATYANRRRVTESRNVLRAAFPAAGRDWFAALVNPRRRMPAVSGILWSFPECDRLRPAPFLPGWVWTSPGDGPRFMRETSGG